MDFTDLLKLIYENDLLNLARLKLDGIDFCMTERYDKSNLLITYAGFGYDHKYQPEELIDFLLDCGMDINQKANNRGNELTALHKAVAIKNYRIVAHLLKRGEQMDVQEINGNTPLWTAVMSFRGKEEHLKIIELLICENASLDVRNFHQRLSGM
ncbi:ankyrin repeat domain-containing protein [Sphingobacterium endophyticum]|uniref:ankyrin repeat domain-containing protein n=1 Tax=Sphingobacterium endophyticum TaxID=2546448 RepID=UPI0018CF434B|nr:ankyrin repeat domain-containing protein [Sphingobacterium endophyticum]